MSSHGYRNQYLSSHSTFCQGQWLFSKVQADGLQTPKRSMTRCEISFANAKFTLTNSFSWKMRRSCWVNKLTQVYHLLTWYSNSKIMEIVYGSQVSFCSPWCKVWGGLEARRPWSYCHTWNHFGTQAGSWTQALRNKGPAIFCDLFEPC